MKIKYTLFAILTSLLATPSAYAGGMVTQNTINFVRDSFGIIMGYSSHANYVNLVCGGTDPGDGKDCDGPPSNGLLGSLIGTAAAPGMVNRLPTIAKNAGITSCNNVPSTGSATGSDGNGTNVTLNFGTATHKVPSGWIGGGTTFAHRVTFSSTWVSQTVQIGVEFNCGDNSPMYTVVSMAVTSDTNMTRDITLFNGPIDANNNGIEVYFAEHNTTTKKMRYVTAAQMAYNPSTSMFNLVGVLETNLNISNSNTTGLAKTFINGNYSTGKASLALDGILFGGISGDNEGLLNTAAIAKGSTITDDSVPTATDFDFTTDLSTVSGVKALSTPSNTTPYALTKQGCVDFSNSTTALTSSTLCSGFSLSAATTAPALDSSGKFDIDWTVNTMPGLLEHISQ